MAREMTQTSLVVETRGTTAALLKHPRPMVCCPARTGTVFPRFQKTDKHDAVPRPKQCPFPARNPLVSSRHLQTVRTRQAWIVVWMTAHFTRQKHVCLRLQASWLSALSVQLAQSRTSSADEVFSRRSPPFCTATCRCRIHWITQAASEQVAPMCSTRDICSIDTATTNWQDCKRSGSNDAIHRNSCPTAGRNRPLRIQRCVQNENSALMRDKTGRRSRQLHVVCPINLATWSPSDVDHVASARCEKPPGIGHWSCDPPEDL